MNIISNDYINNFIGIELDENYFRIAEKRIGEAIKNADMVERQTLQT